jgi:hypothetical protein
MLLLLLLIVEFVSASRELFLRRLVGRSAVVIRALQDEHTTHTHPTLSARRFYSIASIASLPKQDLADLFFFAFRHHTQFPHHQITLHHCILWPVYLLKALSSSRNQDLLATRKTCCCYPLSHTRQILSRHNTQNGHIIYLG